MKFLVWIAAAALIVWLVRKAFAGQSSMTAAEAAKILEVPLDADLEAIAAAHKRLIAKVHPDMGGSADLAARVNLARDVMLRRITG